MYTYIYIHNTYVCVCVCVRACMCHKYIPHVCVCVYVRVCMCHKHIQSLVKNNKNCEPLAFGPLLKKKKAQGLLGSLHWVSPNLIGTYTDIYGDICLQRHIRAYMSTCKDIYGLIKTYTDMYGDIFMYTYTDIYGDICMYGDGIYMSIHKDIYGHISLHIRT